MNPTPNVYDSELKALHVGDGKHKVALYFRENKEKGTLHNG